VAALPVAVVDVNMKKILTGSKAFTLIELMITIGIISLLFAVVIANANSIRSQSNDARRKADLAQIQSALQNYYADMSYYPRDGATGLVLHGATPTTTLNTTVGLGSPAPNPSPSLKTYLKTIPTDNGDSYCYAPVKSAVSTTLDCNNNTPSTFCNYYYLSAHLENPPSTSSAPPDVFDCGPNTKNFFVTPN
jgi:prepilin-type N-terminal cleavage/methylation domain-containing protein